MKFILIFNVILITGLAILCHGYSSNQSTFYGAPLAWNERPVFNLTVEESSGFFPWSKTEKIVTFPRRVSE